VRWLAGLDAPGLGVAWRALAGLSSWWVLNALVAGLVFALLALRRFRHLIVLLIFTSVVVLLAANMVGATARRPRPFGVVIQTSWGGWALPSLQVTFFATILVAILYTLVPEGRWRNTGKGDGQPAQPRRRRAAAGRPPQPRRTTATYRPRPYPAACPPRPGIPMKRTSQHYDGALDKDEGGGSSPPRPTPFLTSGNAGHCRRSPIRRRVCRIRTSYLVTVPCHELEITSTSLLKPRLG
jgi:hypothetical protein